MAMTAQAETMGPTPPRLTDLVEDVSGLVSPPDICVRVFELMRTATSSASDFSEIIARDPNLTTRLLRMVNSSFYGFANRIDTVSRAIAVIGTQELYSLVISVSAVQSFSKIAPKQLEYGQLLASQRLLCTHRSASLPLLWRAAPRTVVHRRSSA